MFHRSLVGSSNQVWKLCLSLSLVFLGAVPLVLAFVNIEQLTPEKGFLLVFGGLFLMGTGLLAGTLLVKCPNCGAKLLWKALSAAPASRWFTWLLTLSTCPVCGYNVPGGRQHHGLDVEL
jgi:predicted RNA-binding Zn-ribbon protein involved in translation (DUF1610 family)